VISTYPFCLMLRCQGSFRSRSQSEFILTICLQLHILCEIVVAGCAFTSGYGLVGMVVLGGWLDSMILEVFSNLWFYDSTILQLLTTRLFQEGMLGACLI